MAVSENRIRAEERAYGEVLRWDEERRVVVSDGVVLRAFSSPSRFRNWWVNRAIGLGIKNPLREDVSGMLVSEEQVREAYEAHGFLGPDDRGRKVLVR